MAERSAETDLDALSRLYGVAAEYKDIWGKPQPASDETRLALLKALGAFDEHSDLAAAARAKETAKWRSILPRAAVFRANEVPYRIRLHFKERDQHSTYRWTFSL